MPPPASYSSDSPDGMYTANDSTPDEAVHGFEASSVLGQTPQFVNSGFEPQQYHQGQNITEQQDTGFDQGGSPSIGTSVQNQAQINPLDRITQLALEMYEKLSECRISSTNSTSIQRREAISGYLETLATLNCEVYNMLQQDCLKDLFLSSLNIASSSTDRFAVDALPLGSIHDTPETHALNSKMQGSVPPHDNNAVSQSAIAVYHSTSNGNDDGDKQLSWHVPGKPVRGTTDWRILREVAVNNPEKFIADYPNDLHDDMLWLIAEQHSYNKLNKFVDRLRYHHPGFEEFAKPPKSLQNAPKEKNAWADKFKNRFCKALARSGEKFGLTGQYKWDVFEPEAGWLDVYRWRENGCPKIIPYSTEEKKAKREARKARKGKDTKDAKVNVAAASNTTEAETSSHGEASDEGEGNVTRSESQVPASVNHDPFREVERFQPMPQDYDHFCGQAQQQSSGYPDLTAVPRFISGHILPEEEYLGELDYDDPLGTGTITADAPRSFPPGGNQSNKRKRAEHESSREAFAHGCKYKKGGDSKINAPQSVSPASVPIAAKLGTFDDFIDENHDYKIPTDDLNARRSHDFDARGAVGILFRQQGTDGPLTQDHEGNTDRNGWGDIFDS